MTIQAIPLANNSDNTNPINNNSLVVSDYPKYTTTPYNPNGKYVFSASSFSNASSQAFNAFDGNPNTYWQCDYVGNAEDSKYTKGPYNMLGKYGAYVGGGDSDTNYWTTNFTNLNGKAIDISGEWLQVNLPSQIYLYKYEIEVTSDSGIPIRYIILGSNDGNSWGYVDQRFLFLSAEKNHIETTAAKTTIDFDINNPHKYNYYRLVITELNGKRPVVKIVNWTIIGDTKLGINPMAATATTESLTNIREKTPLPNITPSIIPSIIMMTAAFSYYIMLVVHKRK